MKIIENKQLKKRRIWIKKFLPRTLFGRSLLILILPVLLIQVISTFIFFDRHWSKMTSRLSYAVAGEISVICSLLDADIMEGNIEDVIGLYADRLGFLISYDKGKVLNINIMEDSGFSGGWETMIKGALDYELSSALSYPYTVDVDFNEKWAEVRVQLSGGVLNISMPQRRLFSSTTYIFLIWVFCATTVFLLISVLFMRNQIRPIRRLSIAAERFGKGRDVKDFKVEGAREVRQAGEAFIDMKTRIQRQISQRTDMLAGVSHDLRTPLTRLKLQISMMGDSPDIYDMKNDISDMEKMIEGYLNFVRGEGREATKITNIPALLREISVAARRNGDDVKLNINDLSVHVPIRPTAFKRCINNIVSNAAKYSDFIWISLSKTGDNEIIITIEDDGVGIEESKFDDVFRPFYRVDSSRNMNTCGVGLGMPIAMDIVHSHGGEIWLEKSRHGGLAVNISLPV